MTCEIAWLYSIYTKGNVDQETGVITYDCAELTDKLREDYNTTDVGVVIAEALEEYYQDTYNLTRSESDYVAFCNQRKMDVQNACTNWQNEIEYRYGLESSSDPIKNNMYYDVCCIPPDEALVRYKQEVVASLCYQLDGISPQMTPEQLFGMFVYKLIFGSEVCFYGWAIVILSNKNDYAS